MPPVSFVYDTESQWNTCAMTNLEADSSGYLVISDGYSTGSAISPAQDGTASFSDYSDLEVSDVVREAGTSVRLYYRTAATEGGLAAAAWHGPIDGIDPTSGAGHVDLGAQMRLDGVTPQRWSQLKWVLTGG